MQYRSHSERYVMEQLERGRQAFVLETGSDNQDDVLIGDLKSCREDLEDHCEGVIPSHWTLSELYCQPQRVVRKSLVFGRDESFNSEHWSDETR